MSSAASLRARGWKSEMMVRPYAHMGVKHLQPYADQLIFPLTATISSKSLENQKVASHKNGYGGGRPGLRLAVSN